MISWSYTLLSVGGGLSSTTLTSQFSGIPTPEIGFAELAFDQVTGDLAFPPRIVRGPDAIIQKIRQRFRFFKGEYFLDTRLGMPYIQKIFIKNPDLILVNAIFKKVLVTTPGVDRVDSFTSSLDNPTRTLTYNFQAWFVNGVKAVAQAEPFIVGSSK